MEREADPTGTGSDEVVVVRLAGSRYALPLRAVAEVGRPPALTRVPGLPTWVAGVANWRGRVLAVVDLRPLLDAAAPPLDRRARLVVLAAAGVRVGLLTESVEGTRQLLAAALEPVLTHLPEGAGRLLAGHVTDPAGPVGLLDVSGVLALADRLPRTRRTA